eukprot:13421050-Alexandrium_andersonii.AAC.1
MLERRRADSPGVLGTEGSQLQSSSGRRLAAWVFCSSARSAKWPSQLMRRRPALWLSWRTASCGPSARSALSSQCSKGQLLVPSSPLRSARAAW